MKKDETNQSNETNFPEGKSDKNETRARENERRERECESICERIERNVESEPDGVDGIVDEVSCRHCGEEADVVGENTDELPFKSVECAENKVIECSSDVASETDCSAADVARKPAGVDEEVAQEMTFSKADVEKLCREAYLRGRNSAIAAKMKADSRTRLDDAATRQAAVPFLAGRKSVWQFE